MLRDDQSFVGGSPRLILRLEGFCLLAGSLWAFQVQHAGWALFAVLFFAPDLSMLGYLVNPRIGAGVYNAVHTTIVYGPLAAYGYLSGVFCRQHGIRSGLWSQPANTAFVRRITLMQLE